MLTIFFRCCYCSPPSHCGNVQILINDFFSTIFSRPSQKLKRLARTSISLKNSSYFQSIFSYKSYLIKIESHRFTLKVSINKHIEYLSDIRACLFFRMNRISTYFCCCCYLNFCKKKNQLWYRHNVYTQNVSLFNRWVCLFVPRQRYAPTNHILLTLQNGRF